MGEARSFAELAKKLERAAGEIDRRSDAEVLLAQVKVAKRTISTAIRLAAPAMEMHPRKAKGKPQRLSVSDVKLDSGSHIVRANGPLHLIERPTKPHTIPRDLGGTLTHTATGRKRSAKSRAKREAELTKVYRVGNRFVRGPIKHPGTRGKYPFKAGVKAFLPSAGKTFEHGVDTIMRGIF